MKHWLNMIFYKKHKNEIFGGCDEYNKGFSTFFIKLQNIFTIGCSCSGQSFKIKLASYFNGEIQGPSVALTHD